MLRRVLELTFIPVDRAFNRLFGSEHNPLYRSGTIAVALLLIVLVTGFYLIFFYRLGAPYDSVVAIQEQVWLGRWIRATHRYASDAAVAAVFLHIARLLIQGKNWGPRTLAWLSGIILTVFLFVSGWTGYVMVWDRFGQTLATTGARVIDQIPVFPEPIEHAFSGSSYLPNSFFFMNLFLHVAIPLGMIVGLWIHTSRLARSVWFPVRRIFIVCAIGFIALGVLWPAPLNDRADLLAMPGQVISDSFFAFWMPIAAKSALAALLAWVICLGALALVPWLLRPKKDRIPSPSFNDPKACQGCAQCVEDCPYEAISMVPRTQGRGSPTYALVDPSVCVSCGICAGSCSSFTIGPLGRKAPDQMKAARAFIERASSPAQRVLVITCGNQPHMHARIQSFTRSNPGFAFYPFDCPGTLHAGVIDQLARHFKALAIITCPPRNCMNREGHETLRARLGGVKKPTLTSKGASTPIEVIPVGDGEEERAFQVLASLLEGAPRPSNSTRVRSITSIATTAVLLVSIAALSSLSIGTSPSTGAIKLSWRLPGQAIEYCVKRSESELAALPAHMRTPENCTREFLAYTLKIGVNGKSLEERVIRPAGARADRPLYVNQSIELPPGNHNVRIRFTPMIPDDAPPTRAATLEFDRELNIEKGRFVLITYDSTGDRLVTTEGKRER